MNTRRFFYNIFTNLFFIFTLIISCSSGGEEPNGGSGPVDPPSEIIPTNLSVNITIEGSSSENPNGDGSGLVKFSASATNAVSYSYRFGTGDSKTATGPVEFTYTDIGTKTYNVKVFAYSSTNNFISIDKAVTVYVKPASEQTLLELLAGSSEKTWKINAAQDAHFSNGSVDKNYPTWWEAYSFSKSDSGFYDDEHTFNVNGTYTHKTNNTVFGKGVYLNSDFGTNSSTNSDGDIENYPLDNYETTFSAKKEDGADKLEFNDKGFIGFYTGTHSYTIECSDENNIFIRTVDDQDRAWYLWLTSETVSEIPSKDQFTNLIWSDEFDYTGAINPDKWTHEVREQWYNNEEQSTTNLLENSKVEDGKLKITAIKKANGDYTSARIRTYKKLDFTYGRIDIKAKMPSKTNGVWPAIWLLGSNYESIDWPACGEIDIQEYAHTNNFNVQSTVHQPDGYAGQGDSNVTYDYSDIDEKFHLYSLVWTKEALTFYVDDKPHHIVGNSCALPFNWDFYLILNFAMGGDMGGDIDSGFTSDSMEIDYVKVYQ
jgi:hypothetical protein